MSIEIITGRITSVGPSEYDAHLQTYQYLKLETAAGKLKLETTVCANELDEYLAPGRRVSMVTASTGSGVKRKTIVFSIRDIVSHETETEVELFKARATATKQAAIVTVLAPFGFFFFIVPGLLGIYLAWKCWKTVALLPTVDELHAAVARLPEADIQPEPDAPTASSAQPILVAI
jgi:hypothetical protein